MRSQRFSKLCRSSILVCAALAGVLGTAVNVRAQALRDVQTPDTPLVLKAQGSFFVGGEKVEQTQGELGDLGPGGHITVNQMYVRYMVPQGGDGNVPVVMVHGATLTGKSWETTPDGRMGWDEYFVRRGHPVVRAGPGRARAIGIQSSHLQQRARGLGAGRPTYLAGSDSVTRSSGRTSASVRSLALPTRTVSSRWPPWTNCRSRVCPTSALAASQPQPHAQGVVGSRQPSEWRGADGTLAVRSVSPGTRRCSIRRTQRASCSSSQVAVPAMYTDEQIETLATIPDLAVFGDHRDTPTGIGIRPSWQLSFEGCQALIRRLKSAGGQAEMLAPAERGIRGNSHMIMQDKNNLQVADLILQWIDQRVRKRVGRRSEEQTMTMSTRHRRHVSGQLQERGDHRPARVVESIDTQRLSRDGREDGRTSRDRLRTAGGGLPARAEGGRGATKAATGRPVDVLQLPDGSILISDDRGNRLIRVSYRR